MLGIREGGADLLDQCILRLTELGERVDRSRRLCEKTNCTIPPAPPSSPVVTPTSPVNFIIDSILLSPVMSAGRAPSRCHECPGPLSRYHKGFAHGVDMCELEHYELCTGDIKEGNDKGGHFWRGCPTDFEPQESSGNEFIDPKLDNVEEVEDSPHNESDYSQVTFLVQ